LQDLLPTTKEPTQKQVLDMAVVDQGQERQEVEMVAQVAL
jgi:hypothetical protein